METLNKADQTAVNSGMTEKKRRGREKGVKIESKAVFIKDPALAPYYLKVEEKSFTLMKEGSLIPEGYFSQLGNALKSVATLKMSNPKENEKTYTLGEYVNGYESAVTFLLENVKM